MACCVHSRQRSARIRIACGLLLSVLTSLFPTYASRVARAETFVWVDERGVTHLSDDREALPEASQGSEAELGVDRLRSLWDDGFTGPAVPTPAGGSGSDRDRVLRLLQGAVQDLARGETARAAAALRSALRLDPRRPEPHWYLALVDRQRGRFDSAAVHLQAFLDRAGPELEVWRVSARQRLATLGDERRLADESRERRPLELVAKDSAHFRLELDAELSEVSSRYASMALEYLEEARRDVSSRIGVAPLEPLGVVFYGKAAYAQAHRHRFSFQTVGFFDGRIHVASPAHPSDSLRSLLFHEYTHAVFRDQSGGDRPYWLNEGLAEQIERASRRQPASTRSERASLRSRIEAGQWIALRRIAASFSGLTDEEARAAYLQSVVAAEWIDARSDREARRRLLLRLGEGLSIDQALHEMLGLDTDGVDRAVQEAILSEFPDV